MNDDLKDIQIDMSTKGVNPELLSDFIKGLKVVDGAEEYLRASMAEDVKAYFNASSPVEQLMIKGAYFRMKWLLNQMTKDVTAPTKKLKQGRYIRKTVA